MLRHRKVDDRMRGEYDLTGTYSRLSNPFDGIRSEGEEILLELEDREFENLPGLAHGQKPIGHRWLGKAVTQAKRIKT